MHVRSLSKFGDGAFEYLRFIFFITTASASGAPALKLRVNGSKDAAQMNQALGDTNNVLYFLLRTLRIA